MTTHLVWLRNDLRITDNKALQAACSDPEARVLAVFIATPQQWRQHEMAPRQAALIHASLQAVQQALAHKGIALHCHSCADFAASIDWLSDYCEREQVDALFYNRQYELNERRRDARLEQRLSGRVRCHGFDDSLLLPPGSVLTGGGEMYKVYTPFRNAFLQRLTESDVSCLPAPKIRAGGALPMPEAPVAFDYPVADIGDGYPAGEEAALQRLRAFAASRCRITSGSAICRPSPAPVACRPIWRSACCRRASASIACAPNARSCWKIAKAVPSPRSTS